MKENNKKKKIGIITLYYGSCNYGGVLQAYALTKYLNDLGYDAEQISFDDAFIYNERINSFKKFFIGCSKLGFFKSIEKAFKRLWQRLKVIIFCKTRNTKFYNLRKEKFQKFKSKNICHSKTIFTRNNISQCKDYDIYITGSDQVWHYFDEVHSKAYWLDFVDNNKCKLAYAVSPTLDYIEKNNYYKVRDCLRDYSSISIRETSGIETLKNILLEDPEDKKCIELTSSLQTVVDSVFLLSAKEWFKIMSQKKIEHKYVLYYSLGDNRIIKKEALKYCKKNNFKIACIPHINGIKLRDEFNWDYKFYDVGPQDFLSLIYYSEAVFTDSFHATAFSIIFNKSCYVYKRTGNGYRANNNRTIDLLQILNLTSSNFLENNKLDKNLIAIVDKYPQTTKLLLNSSIEKSKTFLIDILKRSIIE